MRPRQRWGGRRCAARTKAWGQPHARCLNGQAEGGALPLCAIHRKVRDRGGKLTYCLRACNGPCECLGRGPQSFVPDDFAVAAMARLREVCE